MKRKPFLQHNNNFDDASENEERGSPFIGDERCNGRLRLNARWRARIPQDQWGGGQVSSTWIRVLTIQRGKDAHTCVSNLWWWHVYDRCKRYGRSCFLTHVWDTLESDGSMTCVRGWRIKVSHTCVRHLWKWCEGRQSCKCVRVTYHMWLGFANPLIRIVQMISDVIRWGIRIN